MACKEQAGETNTRTPSRGRPTESLAPDCDVAGEAGINVKQRRRKVQRKNSMPQIGAAVEGEPCVMLIAWRFVIHPVTIRN